MYWQRRELHLTGSANTENEFCIEKVTRSNWNITKQCGLCLVIRQTFPKMTHNNFRCRTRVDQIQVLWRHLLINITCFNPFNQSLATSSTYNRASDVCMCVSHVIDRKLLERLMSPSPKSQVMFAPAFS